MNKRNMERGINNWVLCPSKSFPGKFYYFNVLTGETVWTHSEIEGVRTIQKNNFIQKVNKWHTFPEPDSPPGDRYMFEPSWQRKPDQYLFSRPTMPIFGQPALPLPVYQTSIEPHLPTMMLPPPTMGSVFMGDIKRHTDLQNVWGCDRDSYFVNMDKNKRVVKYEKPGIFNVNCTSTPIKSQWPYDHQKNDAFPTFGQNLSKPRMFEPKTNVIKENIFRQNEDNWFRNNLRSVDESPCFDQTRTSEKTSTKFTTKSSVFQTGRIFGTKSYEDLKTFDDSGYFEMPKAKSAMQKNILMTKPDGNIRVTKKISNENVFSDNFKSSLNPRKRPQSVLSGQEKVDDKRSTNGEKMDGEMDMLNELGEKDLRYILMAKRKKLDNPQGETGKKIKTSYTNGPVGAPVKKRVTFDIDLQSDGDDDDNLPGDGQPKDDEVFVYEEAREEAPLDIKALKRLAKPQTKTDAWYIVVDIEVLFEDFEFIATFVQADSKCRLLIPMAVRDQLDAITVGDCRGRQRVIAARHLARKIASPPDYVTVQVAEECNSAASVSESILSCCLEAIDESYHVVLITNDATLFKKASSIDIPCFTLQEIQDGASAPKPEISFDIRKIKNNDVGRKKQCFSVSGSVNPFSVNNKGEIPVNCFKTRLFDDQNVENTENDGLFFHNGERDLIYDSCETLKTNQTTKTYADCEDFQPNEIYAPENYRESKDLSDTSPNNSEIRQIQENVQNLVIKDVPRNIEIQKHGRLAKPEKIKDRPKATEDNSKLYKNETKTEERDDTAKYNKLKSINGYTIEQHLKKFDVKTKLVEDRIKTRIDEWICSFSQIMEDVLTYTLQDYCGTQSSLAPPWTLAEAVECVRDMYGDDSSVRIIVERLSSLLFNCSCKKGKLRVDMKPKDFMTIFGLGILLIQCLKNVVPTQCEIIKAEDALLSLLQLVTGAGVEPATPEPARAPSVCPSAELADRKNFVKKPSEVIEYLKRHYPEWKTYTETTKETLQQDMNQLKEKGKQLHCIVRTFGKDLHNLKIDNSRAISFNKNTKKDEHSNDVQIAKKAYDTKLDEIETESACDKAIKITGAKLLRKLATNSLHKIPTLQNIDVERRDKSGKELMDMIDSMVGKTDKEVIEKKTANVDDRNNNTDQVNNGNLENADKEPKFVRTFGNLAFPKINLRYNDDQKNTTPANDASKENNNDTKHENPKMIRNFNVMSARKVKNYRSNEKLDLDALDYDVDYNDEDETSQMTIVNDDNHSNAKAVCDDVVKHHEDKRTDDDRPQNANGNGEEHINENVETDTTNDSGFENDSFHAYSLAKTFLTEISETLKSVYSFVLSTAAKFREGRVKVDAKMALHQKANNSRKLLVDIMGSLKCIIARESDDRTSITAALMKAGCAEALNDKRIMKYKQVVSKCLEQARLLEEAVSVVVAATGPAEAAAAAAASVSSLSSDIKYINIFE